MALQTASAARWPERAALSIVEGQPVAVQSPARKRFGHGEWAVGRADSMPGGTPKVAWTSLISAAFSSFASFTAGKNSANSREGLLDGRLARQGREGPRGAHHKFDIAALPLATGMKAAFVVHPVNLAVEQDGVFELGDLPIEPEMHTADGPMLMALDLRGQARLRLQQRAGAAAT